MNKVQSTEYLLELSTFAPLFSLLAILFGIAVVAFLGQMIYERLQTVHANSKKQREITKNSLKSADFSKVKDDKKGELLRKIAEPDGVNPGPDKYLTLDDGGKEIFVRCFTIAAMPKNTDFANTFAGLFDFPGCISSVFVEPLSEGSVIAKMDRQVTVLASEYSSAQGDPTERVRLIRSIRKSIQWLTRWKAEIQRCLMSVLGLSSGLNHYRHLTRFRIHFVLRHFQNPLLFQAALLFRQKHLRRVHRLIM